ncbi:MAG: SDR family NAD(P)-dependent oxidoreductase [Desulfosporosinus sp.]|jgi:2-hydroxycyclohexanecarboxyl-CoA dehydrogenase
MRLDGKNIIVTGAGSGIGKATAIMCASYGANISAVDLNAEALKETSAEIEKHGVKCIAVTTDVTDFEAVTAMVKQTREALGDIDVLVNVVGWDKIQPFWDNTIDYYDKIININLKSVMYCCRAVLDNMMERKAGKIINISSDAGRGGSSGETVYSGAKGGVIAFTKSLAREVARYGILCNTICPGPTNTPLLQVQPEKILQALAKAIPLRRIPEPEEVAGPVVFFASDLANFITGQTISVSGGLTMFG